MSVRRVAQQAGMTPMKLFGATKFIEVWTPDLLAFAELVRADEREACAKVCDENAKNNSNPMNFAENCATDIRARGTK